jgi:hypothetical protein
MTLQQLRDIRCGDNPTSPYTQAIYNVITKAIERGEQPTEDGWIFIGDIALEFNNLKGTKTKQGELHWFNVNSDKTLLWKTKVVNYATEEQLNIFLEKHIRNK